MTEWKILPKLPKFRKNDKSVDIITLKHNEATLTVKMEEESTVYAVIVKNSTENLQTDQIIEGLNASNEAIDIEHIASGTTNSFGQINITFTLLDGETNYSIFITAECILPYVPKLKLEDANVKRIDVTTHKNYNFVQNQEGLVE